MNLETAITDAIGKIAGRKNGVAIVGMAFMYAMGADAWQIFGLGLAAILFQFILDMYEIKKVGKDLSDFSNGNGNCNGNGKDVVLKKEVDKGVQTTTTETTTLGAGVESKIPKP
jgi:amino acid transporter